jgi:hypothetical protein
VTPLAETPFPAQPWFAVRCVFLHEPQRYEERVTLWLADNAEAAVASAEADAEGYADGLDGCEYLGLAQCFHLFDAEVGSGSEVFSLIRESELPPTRYLDVFFDTGSELQRELHES